MPAAFSISEATYMEASKVAARRSVLRALTGVGVPALAAFLVFILVLGESSSNAVLAALGAAIGVALGMLAVDKTFVPWRARKLYRQHKGLQERIEISWDRRGGSSQGRVRSVEHTLVSLQADQGRKLGVPPLSE
jgi:hypothetical protein